MNVGSPDVTVQVRARVVSARDYRDCFFELANGSRHAVVELFPDRLRLSDAGWASFRELPLDLTQFHDLRLTLDAAGTARLFVDSSGRSALELLMKNLNPYWRLAFGNGGPAARSQWREIHYTLEGAFSPEARAFAVPASRR